MEEEGGRKKTRKSGGCFTPGFRCAFLNVINSYINNNRNKGFSLCMKIPRGLKVNSVGGNLEKNESSEVELLSL